MMDENIICPISREIFDDPTICTDGFTYEERPIIKWFEKKTISPMLGTEIEKKLLVKNKALLFYTSHYKGLYQRLKKPIQQAKLPLVNDIKESTLTPKLRQKFDKILEHYYKSTLDLDKCCTMMEEVYNAAPNNFEIIMDYANILRFSTQFDKSLEMIKKLKDIKKKSLIPEYMKIRVLMESGKKSEAKEALEKTQGQNRIENHTLLELRFMSYSLFSVGNRDLAFKIVTSYLSVVPTDPRAISHCIYMNLLRDNYNCVVQMSKKYLKIHKNDISILFHLAKAYTHLKKKDKAVLCYKQISAVSVDKTLRAKALYETAIIRDCNKEFDEMVKELEESYKLDPREEADGYLAALYADKSMFDKAEEWVKACSNRVDIFSEIGRAHV